MMLSSKRLQQMSLLLETMSRRNKAPSDGLGIYLGDGIPRKELGELRSLELKAALDELIELRGQLPNES